MVIYILLLQHTYLWQLHGMMKWSNYKYVVNKDDYISVYAKVIGQEEYYIEKIFKSNKMNLEYEIDGRKYSIWTKLYPDHEIGDIIQVAVDKENYQIIQRIDSYSISNIPLIVKIILLLIWIELAVVLIVALKLYKKEDEELLDSNNRKMQYGVNQIPEKNNYIRPTSLH